MADEKKLNPSIFAAPEGAWDSKGNNLATNIGKLSSAGINLGIKKDSPPNPATTTPRISGGTGVASSYSGDDVYTEVARTSIVAPDYTGESDVLYCTRLVMQNNKGKFLVLVFKDPDTTVSGEYPVEVVRTA